jgi:peptide/nickel transport system ATP-binding protein
LLLPRQRKALSMVGSDRPVAGADRAEPKAGHRRSTSRGRPPVGAATLSIKSLNIAVDASGGPLELVRDVDLELATGQVLGLVGESGSGKTTLVRAIAGFLPAPSRTSGRITVSGATVMGPGAAEPKHYRGHSVSMISQDPRQALNPSMRIGVQIAEAVHNATRCAHAEATSRARELLDLVRIADAARRFRQYPFELSGGMRQRVAIAIALACRPDLLLADEPTTALDVTTQLQIVRLLKELQSEIDMAVVFVSHDLALVSLISDVIAVMYAGSVVECGPARDILRSPQMHYTEALVKCSVAQPDGHGDGYLETIDGDPPGPANRPPGCPFSARCAAVEADCRVEEPPRQPSGPTAWTRCWHPIERAVGDASTAGVRLDRVR